METKELKISVPAGYEIDKENSTFECIKFKKIEQKRWRDNEDAKIKGYYIGFQTSEIIKASDVYNVPFNYNVFATEKQAKSALAIARISQIIANDERFGGIVTDEEWNNDDWKYIIWREYNSVYTDCLLKTYRFLAFHTAEERDLFLQENEDLVKDYLMID